MPPDNDNAKELLLRIAHGEEAAMSEFYGVFSRQVFAFALRQLRDPGEAEDVVVDTMYEVWKSAARFTGGSQVRTWLFSIARHKALDRLRRRPTEALTDEGDEIDQVADEAPAAYERLAQGETAAQVAACLETMSAAHRECLHLVFYMELPLAEVALIQQCPENTVKTRLFHAKRHMKRCLERQIGKVDGDG
jgi:RNA polymerase sigma-70 factor, ECF subfamily